jgi:type IV pilus assembly protein PilW
MKRIQSGFTLVELMIAVVIGLFLTGGLLTLVQAMKRTTVSQAGLSQLQDNQRIAMSLMANAIQSAGYYPNPLVNNSSTFFTATAVAPLFASGQSMTGTHSTTAPGDSITVRYTTLGTLLGDNALSCVGSTSTTQKTWTATLSIDANNNLICVSNDGTTITTVQLVNGVTNLQVLYGVQTSAAALYNSADTYLTATQMTAPYWSAIRSVKITLSFINPLKNQPGQSTVGPTINFTRVITAMNATGVDT